MSVSNVLTTTDSGFESGIGDWVPGGFTSIAVSGTQFHSGANSLALTSVAPGDSTAILNYLVPVLPGVLINPGAWFWASTVNQQGKFNLNYYASDKATIIGTATVGFGALTPGTWTQVQAAGTVVPANVFWVGMSVASTNNNGGNITYIDDVTFGWNNYATNMCPNPSFEQDLTGWAGVAATETLTQVIGVNNFTITPTQYTVPPPQPLYGFACLQVTTPGAIAGEGAAGPATWMPVTTNGSMSLNIAGPTGTVNVSAVNQNTGLIMESVLVTLSNQNQWVNVVVPNLTFVAGSQYYIQITTAGPAQAVSFIVDGVMYNPEPQPSPYVDGQQRQCQWVGAPEESASFQPYQFGIVGLCSFTVGGNINVINPSVTVQVTTQALEFFTTFGAGPPKSVQAVVISPAAAMSNFGIWQGGALGKDLDPAMAYSTWNTAAMSGQTAYSRPYMAVAPPLDQFTSSGGYNWKRAAYMALGWQFLNVAQGQSQVITNVQTEVLPINGYNQIAPRPYQRARQLQVIVKPDRLNFITNPSFESGTANWSSVGSGQTLYQSPNVPIVTNVAFLNNISGAGFYSMGVIATSSNSGGIQITVPYLIPGRIYTCSMWVQTDGQSLGNLVATCENGEGDIVSTNLTGYGAGAYGSGPYGGVYPAPAALPAKWLQIHFTFTANSDTGILNIIPVTIASPTYPYTWFIDAVLLEEGEEVLPYFDGNTSKETLWLDGGTPNQCQSFLYNQLEFARHIVIDSLNQNTPLGISYAQPLYATMPTQ